MASPLRVNLSIDGTYTKPTPGGTLDVKGIVDLHKVTGRGNITIAGGPIRVAHTDFLARRGTHGIIIDGADIHVEHCQFVGNITVTSGTVLEHTQVRTPVPLVLPEFAHIAHGDIRGPQDVVVIPFGSLTGGSARTVTIYPHWNGTHVAMFNADRTSALLSLADVQHTKEVTDRNSGDESLLGVFSDTELDVVLRLSVTIGS